MLYQEFSQIGTKFSVISAGGMRHADPEKQTSTLPECKDK